MYMYTQYMYTLYMSTQYIHIPLACVCGCSLQLEALQYLHESEYAHGDIKGSNLLTGLHPSHQHEVHCRILLSHCRGRRRCVLYIPVHVWSIECRGFESHRGSSFFLGKVTALVVLCCFALFVCLTLLASFFLPSHPSLKTCL